MQTESFVDTLKGLTYQQKFILKEHEQDLKLWGGPDLKSLWPEDYHPETKVQATAVYNSVLKEIQKIRTSPIDYSTFNPPSPVPTTKQIVTDFKAPEIIMGRCPCPDESNVLRCCNLKTLDTIQQCTFGCSYCSIKNFYSTSEIRVVSDLEQKLENLKHDEKIWHIGTGQSSDSLLLGDEYNTVSALSAFAKKNPNIIVELKTKTARTDWIGNNLAQNLIATWSLNAKTVFEKEEHFTASPLHRIMAAKKCSQNGIFVGFHIHPMVYFKGWQDEYRELVNLLCREISPEHTVMVGIGTLTFTKKALKTIREKGIPTRVTQMPLTPVAGKYSYPFETKKEMFSTLYGFFPKEWKEKVFFYLCMEDANLWEPCLNRKYKSNSEFEQDMKRAYFSKIKA